MIVSSTTKAWAPSGGLTDGPTLNLSQLWSEVLLFTSLLDVEGPPRLVFVTGLQRPWLRAAQGFLHCS